MKKYSVRFLLVEGGGSEAFNRTAVNAYLSEVSMDADAKFIELQEAFKDDPAGFASSAEAYRDATIKGCLLMLRLKLMKY